MLHYETIDARTLDLLKRLLAIPEFHNLRLVGGTALALQLGHRISVDLDLFGSVDVDINRTIDLLNDFSNVQVQGSTKNMMFFSIEGVKVDIVNYPYEWIDNQVEEDGLRLAAVNDIAAMKLSAITNRGTKKDFVDLYFLLERFSLNELVDLYTNKYPDGQLFFVLKSLAYFEDAEEQPMPKMLIDTDWVDVKKRIIDSVQKMV
ncbi:MAG: nucleotidyl transferase AbiEii/AbiGii toxin family protein [Salinivirgaceae bacterium]|nr:nucleotidyl transferase AbiEii/AbiGii toxin family protein [Salinivirgaceae bacterium]MBO7433682.1 nucleotidyl transferase AbiEii/AbiGii toxin family protein [Salinivirgaceae bacterium]